MLLLILARQWLRFIPGGYRMVASTCFLFPLWMASIKSGALWLIAVDAWWLMNGYFSFLQPSGPLMVLSRASIPRC